MPAKSARVGSKSIDPAICGMRFPLRTWRGQREVDFFLGLIVMQHLELLIFKAIPVLIWHLHRRMRRIERHVAEERSLAILLDEAERVVGEIVGGEAIAADHLVVVSQRRA